jgi:hypothetical protein
MHTIEFGFGDTQWISVWRQKGFKNWHDCHDWLRDDYNATASNQKSIQGTTLRLHFPDQETFTAFQLAWLS